MIPSRKILLIVMDQFRADCVTGALAQHVQLPHIQALRREAVTFTKHYSVVNPCGSSRASLFTGQYSMNHRSVRNGTPLADGIPNLALEARKSGYEPRLFGYSDTSLDPRSRPAKDPALTTDEQVLPGFTEALEMRMGESYPWRAYLKAQGYDLPEYARIWDSISPDPNRPARPDDPPFYSAEHSDTAFLTDTFLQDMAVRTAQNWFSTLTYLRPHPPLVAPAPYNTMYRNTDLPLPNRLKTRADETALHPLMKGFLQSPKVSNLLRGGSNQISLADDADTQLLRKLYLGLATEVDTHLGRVIDFLKDTGQYDNTLLILTSDHGDTLGDHHIWGKQNFFDTSYHVPLIIRDPFNSAQHGSDVNLFTETIDTTPTILDWIGQDIPTSMDGCSLLPLLAGQTPESWRDAVHMELDFAEPDSPTLWQKEAGTGLRDSSLAILREQRFKLVHFSGDLPPLLFDLEDDPHELVDLANDPNHTATLLRLTQKLLSHRMKHANSTLTGIKITRKGPFGYKP